MTATSKNNYGLVVSALILSEIFLLNPGGIIAVDAFASPSGLCVTNHGRAGSISLQMAPIYNPMSGRWEPSAPEEDASAGYPPIGSLIRQGPVPFIQRLKDPEMYDQAVLKMMAASNMSRDEAQGNMDAYLQNPNDWALQKMEEKNGAPVFDYENANMETDNLILTGAWAGVLLALVVRVLYVGAFGCDDFCRQYHW